jgi:anaerobic selenocysteine-containing dehydrogenase
VDAKARLRGVVERGGKIVVLDPRRSETARIASEHHFIRPGTDAFLLLAMIRTILAEGLEDREFLAANASDVDWLRGLVAAFTPERAAEATGVDAETIVRSAAPSAARSGPSRRGRSTC